MKTMAELTCKVFAPARYSAEATIGELQAQLATVTPVAKVVKLPPIAAGPNLCLIATASKLKLRPAAKAELAINATIEVDEMEGMKTPRFRYSMK